MPKRFPAPSPPVYGGHPNKHSGTNNKPITRVVIHSAVMECRSGAAIDLGRMNQTSETGSWHYSVDPDFTRQCSFDSYVCWHAPPNPHSVGIEMADYPKPWPTNRGKAGVASLLRASRWAGRNHRKMLHRTARLTAELCLANELPIKFLSAPDLRAGRKGITIHANVSAAFGQSSHWDPGIWPRRRFMRLVRKYARDLREN